MSQYKLNDSGIRDVWNNLTIPPDINNRHYREYQKWLTEGNTPDPEFTLEERRANRVVEIKQEAQKRISSELPEYKQRNALARSIDLLDGKLSGTLTVEELDELAGLRSIWEQIKTIRLGSDAAEAEASVSNTPEDVTW